MKVYEHVLAFGAYTKARLSLKENRQILPKITRQFPRDLLTFLQSKSCISFNRHWLLHVFSSLVASGTKVVQKDITCSAGRPLNLLARLPPILDNCARR